MILRAEGEDRTRDLPLTRRMLCQLSYSSELPVEDSNLDFLIQSRVCCHYTNEELPARGSNSHCLVQSEACCHYTNQERVRRPGSEPRARHVVCLDCRRTWTNRDSNPGPPPCRGGALPAEL